ncbi:acetyl-CoA hydrolase/transferase family protein [Labrenzia sp. PHM005]|uniref:acetyl-CoA hydrolase/transferase family protein n=1 Tax=Labrenzia sp. PHM005 TaxID=2590016 RepID=UPI00143CD704|nr:acetyl-CoA hydrolase/transferase family protein [Labrenzia sp. PHM005]
MTLSPSDPSSLNLADYIRPGDLVTWGQAMAEPLELVKSYIEQRHEIGPARAFVGLSISNALNEAITDRISLISYGALGTLAPLHSKGLVSLVPCRYSTMPSLVTNGQLRPDVVFVQLSPPGPDGTHSLGWSNDLLPVAMKHARVVLAEINPAVPWVRMDQPLDEALIHHTITSTQALPELKAPDPGPLENTIAEHVANLIPDGATLQYGVGAVPSAILNALRSHRDLGLHSGLVTDEIVDLATCGALTNARKNIFQGVSVGAVAIGSGKLAEFMTDNPAYLSCQTAVTHGAAPLSQLDSLVAINSALEVDLRGQVNAEQVGSRYLGAIGGQPDFMHAATHAENGLSIIAMPAKSGRNGKRSRIVSRLSGSQVTTARSDVDVVVTEYGAADLRGLDVQARARALTRIAAPHHQEHLEFAVATA